MIQGGFAQAVVVIPAHNEASALPGCLRAVLVAAARVQIPVDIVVVLDSCDDGSGVLDSRFGPNVHFIPVDARNVGVARAAGFSYAHTHIDGDVGCGTTWYATTDADSRVDANWLLRQLTANADMVLGVVRVNSWRDIPAAAARRYLRAYHSKIHPGRGDHEHIHGANMGFTADAYWRVGGFAPLASAEDVDLVRRFELAGYRIRRDTGLSVLTSARQIGRAPAGFAAHLRGMLAAQASGPA
ncbi:glycosyltransferase [Mycobacterium sp. CVI_P3]|uniref:4,4'-diaponeurosporenoate glycosyltransferase n=1 Tax=Mycobacterium pinniadriaticum TaxID=2994102 RepID=A0ABT3SIF2_9MYCO|nr:glycosyltransferase [Mycobacterium pinniadriaticum]MCX2932876.1 glycosyltransferase [Mycobacterium pinniadriaticum]MCX2939299.1 glycosyltransferase [Mycobacterium pinniadriaticum]